MDIQNGTFSLADLSAAIEVNPQTIKAWLNKDFALASEVTGGGGRGQRRRFTFQTLMEFALANAISQVTFGTRDMGACLKAARKFAHVGVQNGKATADAGGDLASLDRKPGLPFHHKFGETIFAVAGEHTAEALHVRGMSMIWAEPAETYESISESLPGDCKDFVAINVSDLFRKICNRMKIDDRDVLDAAYPKLAG